MQISEKFKKSFVAPMIIGILLCMISTISIFTFFTKNFGNSSNNSELRYLYNTVTEQKINTSKTLIYSNFQKAINLIKLVSKYYEHFLELYSEEHFNYENLEKNIINGQDIDSKIPRLEETGEIDYYGHSVWTKDLELKNIRDPYISNDKRIKKYLYCFYLIMPVLKGIITSNMGNNKRGICSIYMVFNKHEIWATYPAIIKQEIFTNLEDLPDFCVDSNGNKITYYYYKCRSWWIDVQNTIVNSDAKSSKGFEDIIITHPYKSYDILSSFPLTICFKYYPKDANKEDILDIIAICADFDIKLLIDYFDKLNSGIPGYFFVSLINSNIPIYYPNIFEHRFSTSIQMLEFHYKSKYYFDELIKFNELVDKMVEYNPNENYYDNNDNYYSSNNKFNIAEESNTQLKYFYKYKQIYNYKEYYITFKTKENFFNHMMTIIYISLDNMSEKAINSFGGIIIPRIITQVFLFVIVGFILFLISLFLTTSLANNISRPIKCMTNSIKGIDFDFDTNKKIDLNESYQQYNIDRNIDEDNNYDVENDRDIKVEQLLNLFNILIKLKSCLAINYDKSLSLSCENLMPLINTKDVFSKVNNLKGIDITESNIGNLFIKCRKFDKAIFHLNASINNYENSLISRINQFQENIIYPNNQLENNRVKEKDTFIFYLNQLEFYRKKLINYIIPKNYNNNTLGNLSNNNNNVRMSKYTVSNIQDNVSNLSSPKKTTNISKNNESLISNIKSNNSNIQKKSQTTNKYSMRKSNNFNEDINIIKNKRKKISKKTIIQSVFIKEMMQRYSTHINDLIKNNNNNNIEYCNYFNNFNSNILSRLNKLIYSYKSFYEHISNLENIKNINIKYKNNSMYSNTDYMIFYNKLLRNLIINRNNPCDDFNQFTDVNNSNKNLITLNDIKINEINELNNINRYSLKTNQIISRYYNSTSEDNIDKNSSNLEYINNYNNSIDSNSKLNYLLEIENRDNLINLSNILYSNKYLSLKRYEQTILKFIKYASDNYNLIKFAEGLLEYAEFLVNNFIKLKTINKYSDITIDNNDIDNFSIKVNSIVQTNFEFYCNQKNNATNNLNNITLINKENIDKEEHNESNKMPHLNDDKYKYITCSNSEKINFHCNNIALFVSGIFKEFDLVYLKLKEGINQNFYKYILTCIKESKNNSHNVIEYPYVLFKQKSYFLKGLYAIHSGHFKEALEYFNCSKKIKVIADASIIEKSKFYIVIILQHFKDKIISNIELLKNSCNLSKEKIKSINAVLTNNNNFQRLLNYNIKSFEENANYHKKLVIEKEELNTKLTTDKKLIEENNQYIKKLNILLDNNTVNMNNFEINNKCLDINLLNSDVLLEKNNFKMFNYIFKKEDCNMLNYNKTNNIQIDFKKFSKDVLIAVDLSETSRNNFKIIDIVSKTSQYIFNKLLSASDRLGIINISDKITNILKLQYPNEKNTSFINNELEQFAKTLNNNFSNSSNKTTICTKTAFSYIYSYLKKTVLLKKEVSIKYILYFTDRFCIEKIFSLEKKKQTNYYDISNMKFFDLFANENNPKQIFVIYYIGYEIEKNAKNNISIKLSEINNSKYINFENCHVIFDILKTSGSVENIKIHPNESYKADCID